MYLELDSRYLTESAEHRELFAENSLTDFCQMVCAAMRKSGCNQPFYARIIKMPVLKRNLESESPKKIVMVKYRRGQFETFSSLEMKLTTPGYRIERAEKPNQLGVNFNLEQFFLASIGNRDEFNSTYGIRILRDGS